MAKERQANSAAAEAQSKKRKREEANDDKKVAKTVKVKGPKFQPLEDPSAIDASKMEGDDIELVLLRVPASFDASKLDGVTLASSILNSGAASLGEGWNIEPSSDSALANLRVLVRSDDAAAAGDDDEDEDAAKPNMRVLRKRPAAALRIAAAPVASSGNSGSSSSAPAGLLPFAALGGLAQPVVLTRRTVPPQLTGMHLRAVPLGFGSAGPEPRQEAAPEKAPKSARKDKEGGSSSSSSSKAPKSEKKEKKEKKERKEKA